MSSNVTQRVISLIHINSLPPYINIKFARMMHHASFSHPPSEISTNSKLLNQLCLQSLNFYIVHRRPWVLENCQNLEELLLYLKQYSIYRIHTFNVIIIISSTSFYDNNLKFNLSLRTSLSRIWIISLINFDIRIIILCQSLLYLCRKRF